jgi:hypothetical protein
VEVQGREQMDHQGQVEMCRIKWFVRKCRNIRSSGSSGKAGSSDQAAQEHQKCWIKWKFRK